VPLLHVAQGLECLADLYLIRRLGVCVIVGHGLSFGQERLLESGQGLAGGQQSQGLLCHRLIPSLPASESI
jgi:hypothetical protein